MNILRPAQKLITPGWMNVSAPMTIFNPPMVIQTYSPFNYATCSPEWSFNDASEMTVDWGDGSPKETHATGLTHTYTPWALHSITYSCPDWSMLRSFTLRGTDSVGIFPSLSRMTALQVLYIEGNIYLTGDFPDINPKMAVYYTYNCDFSGTLPDFSICAPVNLQYVVSMNTHATGYVPGSIAGQQYLFYFLVSGNALPEASVDNILADCVTSLSIPGRAACNVALEGGTNAAPSAAGMADVYTLRAAGWTVTINPRELFTNGGFDANIDGWAGAPYSSLSLEGNRLRVTSIEGQETAWFCPLKDQAVGHLTAGRTYKITYTVTEMSEGVTGFGLWTGTDLYDYQATPGTYTATAVVGIDPTLWFQLTAPSAGLHVDFDNFSLLEL
jgi:hypothetical protein